MPGQNPDQNTDQVTQNPNSPVGNLPSDAGSYNTIRIPGLASPIKLPTGLDKSVIDGIAGAAFHAVHSAGSDAWQELKDSAQSFKSQFLQPPPPDAPSDEKHVALLGPFSLTAYRMGKQALESFGAAKIAASTGESDAGVKLAALEKMPMISDLVSDMESGKTGTAFTRGLVRAALLKGVGKAADLSAAGISTTPAEISSLDAQLASRAAEIAKPKGLPEDVSTPRMEARAQFTRGGDLNPIPTVNPTIPMSIEQRLAQAFIKGSRLEHGLESTNVTPVEVARESASDQALQEWITKTFGSENPEVVQVRQPEEGPLQPKIAGEVTKLKKATPTEKMSAEEQDARLRGYLTKLERGAAPDDVEQLYQIRKRLGLTEKPSVEALKTQNAAPLNQAALNAIKARPDKYAGGPTAPKVVSTPMPDNFIYSEGRLHVLETTNGQRLGAMATSPTEIPGEVAIRNVEIAPKYQNQGHSIRLYTEAAKDLQAQGYKVLRSDPVSINSEASRTWESLSRTQPITKSINPVNGDPVYKWDLTAKSVSKQAPVSLRTDLPLSRASAAQSAAAKFAPIADIVEKRINSPVDLTNEWNEEASRQVKPTH